MRKNLIPLLAVALVIAGLCTVIFYGLIADRFSGSPTGAQAATLQLVAAAKAVTRGKILESGDLKLIEAACPVKTHPACFQTVEELLGRPALEGMVDGQPITDDLVAKRKAGASPSAVIPVGMRAVTLHAADSRGVVEMIRAGDRVDLQVIGSRDPQALVTGMSVQRVWPNVEVLSTAPPDPGSSHNGRPVLTVLMPPAEAERLSLADTTSRIRVVLRNREESTGAASAPAPGTSTPAPAATTPAVRTSTSAPASAPASAATSGSKPAPSKPALTTSHAAADNSEPSFLVRLVSVQPSEMAGLGAGDAGNDHQPQIRTVARRLLEDRLSQLEVAKTGRVLGSQPLAVGPKREAALAWAADGQPINAWAPGVAGVRLRLRSLAGQRWRVEPEAQTGTTGATAARRSEADATVDADQAWLVSGLLEHKEGRPVFSGQGAATEPKLLLLITPIPR